VTHRRVRQDAEVRRLVRRCQKLRVGQRSLHEERFERCRWFAIEGVSFRFVEFNAPEHFSAVRPSTLVKHPTGRFNPEFRWKREETV
jgi:hypothetical protein